jgi:3-hydroxyacyl-CoA dehydrogenase
MERRIESVAVLGAGTMGSGIAAICAQAGCPVLLLDVTREASEAGLAAMTGGRAPMLDDPAAAARITPGSFDEDLAKVADYDWICEVVVEDLAIKRALFERLEPLRRDGSVVSSNTSGITLRALTEGMPERLQRDMAVTHFFNPVRLMKLVELVPGAATSPDARRALEIFLRERLGKGVVHGKDTVNFVGNRIGCFWMLAGLLEAEKALAAGLSMEEVDALLSAPVGIPPTGLYGLIDLIGLDVMDLVARNLAANLPAGDTGLAYARLPAAEQAMVARGQIGRKAGAGFYRMTKQPDGSRLKEVYDLVRGEWRPARKVELAPAHREIGSLLFADDVAGRFVWALMGGTFCYAADLVPEITDDVVNVDRAMRWGYNWAKGPFELMDAIGPDRVIARLRAEGRAVPRMLAVLEQAGGGTFYRADGKEFLGVDGAHHPVPA